MRKALRICMVCLVLTNLGFGQEHQRDRPSHAIQLDRAFEIVSPQ